MAKDTLDFFNYQPSEVGEGGFTIEAAAFGSADGTSFPINIQVKTGNRLRISNQNRQANPNRRHPAWSESVGFPVAPNDVKSRTEAAEYFPKGGVRIFISRLSDQSFMAGFTCGPAPSSISPETDIYQLYVNSGVGGVLWNVSIPLEEIGSDVE
jgi:hypothetical protein